MRAFSAPLLAELREEVFAIFWTIELNFVVVQRFIDIDIDIYQDGERYLSYPFKIGDITYTSDMAIDSVTIEIANADLSMSALLLGSDVAGSEATVSFGCLDSNYEVIGVKEFFYGNISGWKILRDRSVELTVVNEFMLWKKKTLRIAQASCPWPFKVMSDGLIGYWPMDTGSGIVVYDKTQNGNDGDLNGCTWVPGISGKAISFDYTSDDHILVADNAELDLGTGDFSIAIWTQINAFQNQGSSYNTILIRGSTGIAGSYGFAFEVDGDLHFFAGSQSQRAEILLSSIDDGEWHLIVGTRESGYLKLYLDAVKGTDGDYAAVNLTGSDDLFFGGDVGVYRFIDGLIDQVRFYNRALTQAEVTFLYKNPTPGECQYGGGGTWCDQTYARCVALGNEANFGGFRFLPYIMEKEVWWGGPKPTE